MRSQHSPVQAASPLRLFFAFFGLIMAADATLLADRFPDDPVEKFKQALLLETSKKSGYKSKLGEDPTAFRYALKYRQDTLTKAEQDLRTASDLSRALLLLEWPRPAATRSELEAETKFEREARKIEEGVRKKMTDRLVRAVRDVFRTPVATPDDATRQIAMANLVGETVAAADPQERAMKGLYDELQKLAKDLADLSTSPRYPVREAAARALGQFPDNSAIAAAALGKLLDRSNPESTRKAAADALQTLVLNVSANQPMRGSEPGISTRETRRLGKALPLDEIVTLVKNVAQAGGAGLGDPSVAVRRSAITALRHAAETLAFEVRGLLPTSAREIDLPPADRPWSKEEAARVADQRRQAEEDQKMVLPALRAFGDQGPLLLKAALDNDPEVRLNARQTLNALAQARDLLQRLRDWVPTRPKSADEGKAGAVRLSPPPVFRLPVPATPVSRRQEKDKEREKDTKEEPGKAGKDKDADPIGSMLKQIGEELVTRGYRDPNASARRATIETIEAMGPSGAEFIPQLIAALKDPDLFVRWIAARALGKLAPREAATVVPALAGVLDDVDLDPRIAAAKALAAYGPDAAAAVPALTERLNKGDAEFRIAAMKAIEAIGTEGAPALPELAKALGNIDPRVRGEAARVLGRFGPLARGYVDDLRKLSDDPDSAVRRAASGAVLSIMEGK